MRLFFLLLSTAVCASGAPAHAAPAWERIDAAQELLQGAIPRPGAIELELPLVTQEGGSVPLTVSIRDAAVVAGGIAALYLFASGNPSPELAEFRFPSSTVRPQLSTRIRLDRSQSVIALARTHNGEWLVATREVRVTVSGCLSRANAADGDQPMHVRVRAPNELALGESGDVRAMIIHPMETGLRKDETGQVVPMRIIRQFRVNLDGDTILDVRLHRAIAANPYFQFPLAPQRSGTLQLAWEEDTGRAVSESLEVRVRPRR